MRFSTLLVAAAAASLVASPLLAQGSASKLSIAPKSGVRASAPVTDASNQEEGAGASGVILGVGAAIAAGLGLYLALDSDDEDDLPTSP